MELQKLCVDNLVEFLGDGANSFTKNLFQALENGSVSKINNESQNMEPSQQPFLVDETHSHSNISPKRDNLSTSSEQPNNFEDQYVSDDNDDDDRNHKHRRREEAEPNSVQNGTLDKPNKKYNKPFENVQESNPTSGRNYSSKFNNHRPKFTPKTDPHTRFNQPAYFDLSASVGCPIGRRRGRGPWNQNLRFNCPDTLASHTNPFVGPNSQNSWGGYGFIAGMTDSLMDPLKPFELQGALGPNINPSLNIGQSSKRCRDFEERGFCLRGDMCPLEHGSNRIVVEDVQSLSQFNLPVPNRSSGALPPSSSLLTSSKSIPIKSIKSGTMDVSSNLNNIPSTSISKDVDVYDPDQPLWNTDALSISTTLLRHSSLNIEGKSSYDVNATPLNNHSSSCRKIGSVKPCSVKMVEHREDYKEPHVSNKNRGASEIGIGPKANSNYVNKNEKHLFPKASRTIFVNGIPQKSNKRDALITHFQKFGEVVDLYIPSNSEIAFVQFFKREAAEAALDSSDAVMGNRFIKLSWANRDKVLDNGPSIGQNKFIQPLASKLNTVNGEKEIGPNSNQESNIAASNTSFPVSAPVKNLTRKSHKTPAPKQKKLEKLELLEELRKKQESLDKKRNDFRRQLEEFAKQTVPNKKGDVISEQGAKRQKIDASRASIKAAGQVTDKNPEKNREVLASNGSKINPLTVQKPLRNICQISSAPVLTPNRYKLDNRSTSFKILPPLPVGFANATAIKDHFSCYGAISSAVIEDPGHIDNGNPTSCEKCSACITFADRQSAEKAFAKGKCWEGSNLNLRWLTTTQNLSNNCSSQETPSSLPTSTFENAEAEKPSLQSEHGPEDMCCLAESMCITPEGRPQSSILKPSAEERAL